MFKVTRDFNINYIYGPETPSNTEIETSLHNRCESNPELEFHSKDATWFMINQNDLWVTFYFDDHDENRVDDRYPRPVLHTQVGYGHLVRESHPAQSERIDMLLDLVELTYNVVKPVFVYGLYDWEEEELILSGDFDPPVTGKSLANNSVNYINWVTALSPVIVETYGKQTLENLPTARFRELADGGVLFISTTEIAPEHFEDEYFTATEELNSEFQSIRPH